MNELYRAHFVDVNDEGNKLTVDLALNPRRHWVSSFMTSGWWGRIAANDHWPFVCRKDGVLDMGNDALDPTLSAQRFAHFDISDQIIASGEIYKFSHRQVEYAMRLESLRKVSELLDQAI